MYLFARILFRGEVEQNGRPFKEAMRLLSKSRRPERERVYTQTEQENQARKIAPVKTELPWGQ